MKTIHAFRFLCVIALSGCATSITPISTAARTPADRIYYSTLPTTSNPATVNFIRDTGVLGVAIGKRVLIDDELAAILEPGEVVSFKIDAGQYVFSTYSGPNTGLNNPTYLDQKIDAGKSYYYRLFSDLTKTGQIGRVSAKTLSQEGN